MDLEKIQKKIAELGFDGWLLYDFHGSNRFVKEFLSFPPNILLSRRFFYWIPKKGNPIAILHKIEAEIAEHLLGAVELYLSWQDLDKVLRKVLKSCTKIAMEYSPHNANPYVSKVDAGTVEWVREIGPLVESSQELLQHFTSVLDEKQIESHLKAAEVLVKTAEKAWETISDHLKKGKKISELDVQSFICKEFESASCITEYLPICAVNEHSALPHYSPSKSTDCEIKENDFILIDLWCKKNEKSAVFADITKVGVAAAQAPSQINEIFEIVKTAQEKAYQLIVKSFSSKKTLTGAEVDDACRAYIKEKGYGNYFTHRTGHSIDTDLHGAGAHIDNFETADFRKILPATCFSLEPAIYLPGEFGVRLEYDILIKRDSSVHITGGQQESIVCLL